MTTKMPLLKEAQLNHNSNGPTICSVSTGRIVEEWLVIVGDFMRTSVLISCLQKVACQLVQGIMNCLLVGSRVRSLKGGREFMIHPNVVNLWINQGRNKRQKQEQRIEMRLFVFMKSKCKSSALLCMNKCLLDFVRCPFYVIL